MFDLDTKMGLEAQEILEGTCMWTEKMYDMQFDIQDLNCELYQYIAKNGKNGIVYIEYSYKQIGLTEEWLRNIFNKINNPLVFKREVLLYRLKGSSASPYSQEDVEAIVESRKEVVREIFLQEYYRLDMYVKEFDKYKPYLVGIDTSTGTLSDNNAITILDPYKLEPVAEFKCSYIGETAFKKVIISLIMNYIPRAVVVIERNSVGDAILDGLLEESPIAQNLYFDKDANLLTHNINDKTTIESMLKKKAAMKTAYGVYTTGKSRDDMFSILARHVSEYKEKFITRNITNDISGLVVKSSGRIEAGPGFHDDSLMSYLMTLYVYYHGNNLSLFGINKGAIEDLDENSGLRREPTEITSDNIAGLIPDDQVEIIRQQERVNKNNYEEVFRQAMLKSQRESMRLRDKGLSVNRVLEKTKEDILVESEWANEQVTGIDMDFFDEMNGFSGYNSDDDDNFGFF